MSRVTYIVSAFDRPKFLRCCLASIAVQTDPDFEVIVADNSTKPIMGAWHQGIVDSLRDPRFRLVDTAQHATSPAWDCYWSAEWIVEHEAKGEWICLPNDDSYYMPLFQEALLAAAQKHKWKFIYCDMVYDRRLRGKYAELDVGPWRGAIDKTGFLLHRSAWIGFPHKPTDRVRASTCDGDMAYELTMRGVNHGKVHEILVVHN